MQRDRVLEGRGHLSAFAQGSLAAENQGRGLSNPPAA